MRWVVCIVLLFGLVGCEAEESSGVEERLAKAEARCEQLSSQVASLHKKLKSHHVVLGKMSDAMKIRDKQSRAVMRSLETLHENDSKLAGMIGGP